MVQNSCMLLKNNMADSDDDLSDVKWSVVNSSLWNGLQAIQNLMAYYYRPNVEMTTTSYIKVTLDALNIPDISLLIFSNKLLNAVTITLFLYLAISNAHLTYSSYVDTVLLSTSPTFHEPGKARYLASWVVKL